MNKQYLFIIAVQSLMIRILGNLFSLAIIYENRWFRCKCDLHQSFQVSSLNEHNSTIFLVHFVCTSHLISNFITLFEVIFVPTTYPYI